VAAGPALLAEEGTSPGRLAYVTVRQLEAQGVDAGLAKQVRFSKTVTQLPCRSSFREVGALHCGSLRRRASTRASPSSRRAGLMFC